MSVHEACNHLRQAANHRLREWDELQEAETLLGHELSLNDGVQVWLSGFYAADDVLGVSDEDVLRGFNLIT